MSINPNSLTTDTDWFVEDLETNMEFLRKNLSKSSIGTQGFLSSVLNYYDRTGEVTKSQLIYLVKYYREFKNEENGGGAVATGIDWDARSLYEHMSKNHIQEFKATGDALPSGRTLKLELQWWKHKIQLTIGTLNVGCIANSGRTIIWVPNASTNETKIEIKRYLSSENREWNK